MKSKFSIILQVVITTPLLVLFLAVIWQVFARYALSIPSKYSEELIRFSLVFLTFLAGSYCFIINRHIALDLIEMKATSRLNRIIKLVQAIIILSFSVFILIYGGLYKAVSQYSQLSSSFNIPMFYIYMIMPISGLIITIWAVKQIIKTVLQR